MLLSLYIINKAGGLIYQKDYGEGRLAKLTSNEYLVLAVHAIASKISPQPNSSGIELLEGDTFKATCFQTLTGTKFLLFTDPGQPNCELILRRMYELYSDFVMKNPFYNPEMPIRIELFDTNISKLVKQINGA
ncbi:hypothetical protein SmJEL517_g02837 [Synchytrium microbalum]|uniref:Trafficking protein particle complex subunit n=1 Tax=Synchytrium microbalum TaxID=1806994 RepID=A0A507CAK3_9FUNG|nr:uncharacterized protein SmJEL517_g02837 [Synchytrium microbalum]TPX34545.1 hypothetical protein SmJEL517_g02837 [Synchytrium microbalum]